MAPSAISAITDRLANIATSFQASADAPLDTEPYEVKDQWHSKLNKMKVIHVGAGAAGLLVAYKMKKNFKEFELVCYEKNPAVAGTWYENRYPGCACDIPAHIYTYPFDPNPNWSTFYAYSPEIRQYFEDFADKNELRQFIQLNSKIISAKWDAEKGTYEVEIEQEGKVVKDWCNVLINGTGFLNSWKWPEIPGLHDFEGTLLHSANWDPSVDWKDKTVAVIGTGSSAIQIVPQMQKSVKHLTAFMRSVTWISPPFAGNILQAEKTSGTSNESPAIKTSGPVGSAQYYYTDAEKARFRDDPEFHLKYRKNIEETVNAGFPMFLKDSATSKGAEAVMRAEMERRIGPGHEELKEKMIPKWPPGCRRLTPGDGYLEALVMDNVTTVHKEITRVVNEGVVDDSGFLHKVDVLVCATGFNIAFAPPFDIRGINDVSMKEEFDPEPYVYLAVTVPKFPNYFVVNGVRGNWAQGAALPSHEIQVEYILKCVKRMQTDGIKALEVKREPVDQLYEHIDEWHKGSVWGADCKSWYKNNQLGGKLWIWAGSALHYMKTMQDVRWEHYTIHYHTKNMWSFLGNGRIEAEVLGERSKLAPYIRNADTPYII